MEAYFIYRAKHKSAYMDINCEIVRSVSKKCMILKCYWSGKMFQRKILYLFVNISVGYFNKFTQNSSEGDDILRLFM